MAVGAGTSSRQVALLLAVAAVAIAAQAPVLALAGGPPELDLATWNRAFKYEAAHVPPALLKSGAAMYDGGSASSEAPPEPMFPLVGYDVQRSCAGPSSGQALDPTKAKLGACQYSANKDGSFTYWEKQPGDWARLSNCYCYALNTYKGAWCNPGGGGGAPVPEDPAAMSCAVLKKAVLADGAKEVTRQQALNTQPPQGHYVALVFRPQESCNYARCVPDYHFLRKDSNGLWSHKAGEAPATNLDADGKTISDPMAAKLSGRYTQLCGYFQVQPEQMKIGTMPVPNLVDRAVSKWKASGLAVSVQPLAYNAAVDAAGASVDYAQLQQQQFALQRGGQGARRLLLAAANTAARR